MKKFNVLFLEKQKLFNEKKAKEKLNKQKKNKYTEEYLNNHKERMIVYWSNKKRINI